MELGFEEDVSFKLEGFSPAQLCPSPGHCCLVAVSSTGGLRSLNLASGDTTDTLQLTAPGQKLICSYHEQSKKLVVGSGRNFGARGAVGGSLMLRTLLQSPVEEHDDSVSIEITVTQAEILHNELDKIALSQKTGSSGSNKQSNTSLISVIAQLTRELLKTNSSTQKEAATVCFDGPVHQLFSLFYGVFTKLRTPRGASGTLGGNYHPRNAPSTPPPPALPLVAEVCLRLCLLHPDHHSVLEQLERGEEVKDNKMAYCEAVRKLSLRKWPHKDYNWAVPSSMAAAGFFHMSNNSPYQLPPSGVYKGDRVSCFACGIYLYTWEPNDEPWSEHERHAMQCSYMRGDYTENVSLEVSEGTHPALQVTSDPTDRIEFLAISPHSNLVAMATKHGVISCWDVGGSLCILLQERLQVKTETLQSLLSSDEKGCGLKEVTSFSFTSLALFSPSPDSDATLLVAGVTMTLHPSSSTHSFLIVHSISLSSEESNSSHLPPSTTDVATSLATSGINDVLLMGGLCPSPHPPPLPPRTYTTEDTSTNTTIPHSSISLVPISNLLPDHHGNYEVRMMQSLSSSHLVAVYVVSIHHVPNESVLMIMSACEEKKEWQLCSEPGVKRVMEDELIIDMCYVMIGTGREVLVVITTKGTLQLLDVGSLEVIGIHTSSSGCGFISCTAWHANNGGWVATVTQDEQVEVVKVCELKGGGERGDGAEEEENETLEYLLLREHLTSCILDGLLSLIATSPVGVAYTARSTRYWKEINLQQFHRKVPTHMHPVPCGGCGDKEGHTHKDHTRVWQYIPPPTHNKDILNNKCVHYFELFLDPLSSPVGCVSVRLTLPSSRCLSDTATVSLVLPPRQGLQGRENEENKEKVLCGPIKLTSLVDVTGCIVQASFTHPLLLTSPLPQTLALKLEQLFASDYTKVAMAAAEAHIMPEVKAVSLRRRGCIVHRSGTNRSQQSVNQKQRVITDQCYLSLSLYPLTHHISGTTECSLGVSMSTLLRLGRKKEFVLNLILGACLYRVETEEYDRLPETVSCLVGYKREEGGKMKEGGEDRTRGDIDGGVREQLQCLQLLCWLSCLYDGVNDTECLAMIRSAVGQLTVSLVHSSFINSHSRQTAHYCARLILSLYRPQELSPSSEVFIQNLVCSFPTLLPLLPHCTSAACVHWFLRLVSMVAVKSHDRHVIIQHCMSLVVDLAQQLQQKSNDLIQLLHTNHGQDGCVFEDHLYDVYLAYYQRTSVITSKPNPTPTTAPPPPPPPLQTTSVPLPPLATNEHYLDLYPYHPPPGLPFHAPQSQNSLGPWWKAAKMPPKSGTTQVIYSDRKNKSIYDTELQLLLKPPPSSPAQVRKTLNDFPPFQHGSFLLYAQRGLLETYPLQYTCCSVTGNATVQEQARTIMNTRSLSHFSPVTASPELRGDMRARTLGYFYPTAPSNTNSSHNTSSVSYRTPKSMSYRTPKYPNEFTTGDTIPKELVMSIAMFQSGQAYSAVLKLNQPVHLTDISISSNSSVGCVSVDVWKSEGGEEEAVRVAQSTEIHEKNLLIGNLIPSPLCQFVKVTYTGRLGAGRERIQLFLGTYYGIPLLTNDTTTTSTLSRLDHLSSLEGRLLHSYLTTREDLTTELITSSNTRTPSGPVLQDTVKEKYQACFLAQTRLARLRHYMMSLEREGGEIPDVIGDVFSINEVVSTHTTLSLSQLYRLAGCLVNVMLMLCGPEETGQQRDQLGKTILSDSLSAEQLPEMTEEECHLLISTLCVHSVLRVQARTCALLLRLCGSRPWWGDMIIRTATHLFSSNQTGYFNKERVMLQLSVLCQRSYQHGPILTSLLHALTSLIPSPSPSPSDLDHHQLQWMILLLSHILSCLYNTNGSSDSSIFTPSLNIKPHTQHSTQPPPPRKRLKAGAERRSYRQPPPSTTPSNQSQSSSPPSSQPSSLLTLPFPLVHDVIKGLLVYIEYLISQSHWILLPVVCKVISLLAELSSHPLPLTSLVTSSQLTHLILTTCTRHDDSIHGNRSPSDDHGNQQWAYRSIQCMVMSLLYYGELLPHSEQCRRERGEGRVMERDLPVREKVEIIEKRDSEREGVGVKSHSVVVEDEVCDNETTEIVESFPDSLETVDAYNDGEMLFTYHPLLSTLDPVTMEMLSSVTMPTADMLDFDSIHAPPPVPIVPHNIPPSLFPAVPTTTKKKLTKQHNYKKHSTKYAPGDYTNVPMPRPPDHTPSDTSSDLNVNPYHTYLISSCVDHRLQYSLEYPIELTLQNLAHTQYETVMRSLLTAAPASSPMVTGDEEEREECGLGTGVVSDFNDVCVFVCNSLETLLKSTMGVACQSPSIDLVCLLQYWCELNNIYPRPLHTTTLLFESLSPRSAVTQTPHVFTSNSILTILIECLSHASSDHTHHWSDATWQVGLTLLNQFVSHLFSSSSSLQHDHVTPLHFQPLQQLLLAYFLSGDRKQDVGVAEDVVLSLLKQLLLLRVVGVSEGESEGVRSDGGSGEGVGDGGSGEGECDGASGESGGDMIGVHVLLDVLVHLLEKRPSLLDSPILLPLIEALNLPEVPRLLFPCAQVPCQITICYIHRLLSLIVSLVHSTQHTDSTQNVLLYSADSDGDRMRHRYHRSSAAAGGGGGGSRIKWILIPQETTGSAHRSKVTKELIQLVKQLLSISKDKLSDSAHKAIREFIEERINGGIVMSCPMFPMATLIYNDVTLLSNYLSLLNDIEIPPRPPSKGKTPSSLGKFPSETPPSDFTGKLFHDYIIDFLYLECPDRTCFHQPVINTLRSSVSESVNVSKLFLSFVSRMVCDMVKSSDGNYDNMDKFIKGGGVELVCEHFVWSYQSTDIPSLSPSSSVPSTTTTDINNTILHIGQQSTDKVLQEGAQLVNYLPLAKLHFSPGHKSLADLQAANQGEPPSRSSSFHYTFEPHSLESELVVTAILPHPVLFCSLQLFQPLGSLQNGPSSVLIETARTELTTPIPAMPTIITKGLAFIKIELRRPVVAQEVKVHLRRPAVSDSITLSHMYILGVRYGGNQPPGEPKLKDPQRYPSCSDWLNIIEECLRVEDTTTHQKLMKEAASVPHIVPTCLSLITTHYHTLPFESVRQLLHLLLELDTHCLNDESRETVVDSLIRLPLTSCLLSPAAVELFYHLCITNTINRMTHRLLLCLQLLVSDSHVTVQPGMVRALSSAIWHGKHKVIAPLITEQLFSSLADIAVSSSMCSPMKQALNSLLCSVCYVTPHHLTLLLDRCFTAFTNSSSHLSPDLSPLLSTLASTAHSSSCSTILTSSLLLSSMVTELYETFTNLVSQTQSSGSDIPPPSDDGVVSISAILPRLCTLLAFLTDFSRDWIPAKVWLGSEHARSMWIPLLHFLSLADNHPQLISTNELIFLQDVGLEFFRAATTGNMSNKINFIHLLINSLTGGFSFEQNIESQQEGPPITAVSLTSYTHRLLVEFILEPEVCLVVLESSKHLSKGPSSPLPLSLPLTYESSFFHPSMSISQHSYLVSLPMSSSLSDLSQLCQTPANDNVDMTPVTLPTIPVTSLSAQQQKKWSNQLQKLSSQDIMNRNTKSTGEKLTSQPPQTQFSLSPNSPYIDLPKTLCQLMHTITTPLNCLSLTKHSVNTSSPRLQPNPFSNPGNNHQSMLEIFADNGGLVLLSHCLPSLYPQYWSTFVTKDTPDQTPPSLHDDSSYHPFTATDVLAPQVLVTFGLCLRLRYYGDALIGHSLSMACTLIMLLLGAECKESLTPAMAEELTFAPYNILLNVLQDCPAGMGVACRVEIMKVGVVNQILITLSSLGHQSRATPTNRSSSHSNSSASSHAVSKPVHGMTSGQNRLYWAKGTGFGTGSTASAWNVDAMKAKQKQEEKHTCLCFKILCEYFSTRNDTVDEQTSVLSWCTSDVMELLANSSLLPALATYLVNDSILDISKHIDLYESALGLLYSLTSHSSLHPLLTIPIFPTGQQPSSTESGLTLFSLSKKLMTTATSYINTAKLKTKATSGDRLRTISPVPPRPVKITMETAKSKQKGGEVVEDDLITLLATMQATSNMVSTIVSNNLEQDDKKEGEEESEREEGTVIELTPIDDYMVAMEPLQFDTFKFLEEDEDGQPHFFIPYHYQSRLQPSLTSVYGTMRAWRLAQEVSSLTRSLPLSSSSSVFVRCDENRLDVLKVLITGPSDTPYANGCFEFDVTFPPEYPQGPMLVNLMTTGQGTVRFNPNLYNDGKVCLSVLNTWHGRPEEKWNSETSSFLQVLVSIQSLVLVSDPYFNEPGYEQYRGTLNGDQRSLTYNANIYIATIQWAMINQLQNPSPCFKEVILKHFHLRHEEVITQCQSWVRTLSDGIERLQSHGMATAQLNTYLKKLIKIIDTLRVELNKVEKKLALLKAADESSTVEASDGGSTVEASDGGSTVEASDGGSTVETTGVGSTVETTGVGSTVETTGVGSTVETTGVGSTVETTGVGSTVETTGGGSTVETTGGGGTVETTGGGSTVETTGVGSTVETTGGGGTVETTGGGSTVETTGGGSTVETNDDLSIGHPKQENVEPGSNSNNMGHPRLDSTLEDGDPHSLPSNSTSNATPTQPHQCSVSNEDLTPHDHEQ